MSKTQQRIITRRALAEKSYRQGGRDYRKGIFRWRRHPFLAAYHRGYLDEAGFLGKWREYTRIWARHLLGRRGKRFNFFTGGRSVGKRVSSA